MKNLTSKSQKSQCAITAVVLGISILSGSHLRAATLYWDGITSGNWSDQTNWSTASGATTPSPLAAPEASDDAVFNITTANNVNQEVSLNSSNRSANSILINNSGTTFFRRLTNDSGNANFFQVGAGGFTMSSTSGAVSLGTVSTSGQRVGLRAATGSTSLSITNNSSSLLTFNHATQTRTNDVNLASTITYAGSGSGGILQTGEVSKPTTSDGSVAVTVNMTGTGVVTFAGANTYDGLTTISAGTIALSGSGTLGDAAGNVTVSGGTLNLGALTRTRTGNIVLSGGAINNGTLNKTGGIFDAQSGSATAILGGTAGLTKTTGGSVTLSGANTYTGATNVTAGTLIIGASGSLANTTTTIGVNGTLAGGGTINGATTINGNHNPGFSPGTQTFTNSLTYGSTATLNWELTDNITTGRGTNYDAVNVSGGLFTLTTGATIDLSFGGSVDFLNAFWGTDQEWLVVDLSGTTTAADSNLFGIGAITGGMNYSPTLGTFGIERKDGSTTADAVYLTWTAIPEPTTALLGGLGMLLLLRRRRA